MSTGKFCRCPLLSLFVQHSRAAPEAGLRRLGEQGAAASESPAVRTKLKTPKQKQSVPSLGSTASAGDMAFSWTDLFTRPNPGRIN
jgi:hypothetical protein